MNPAGYDVAVIGGGIVGLSTAMELLGRAPALRLILLEKEPDVAMHQTSHNSGVIHSGVYYRPGSLKARLCVAGAKLMAEFCQAHQIPHRICGKVIVATQASELPALAALYQRGLANGVGALSVVGPERLQELEPHARGLKALHVGSAGVVDYAAVARVMADVIRERGGDIRTGARVLRLARRQGDWVVEATSGELCSRLLITCGGLQADRLAAMAGAPADMAIVPFRGEYYEIIPERRFLVRSMVYPVPDPAMPFLGAHFTRSITGGLHAGPNAVLALKREGYRRRDVSLADTASLLRFAGFWRMAQAHWSTGLAELHRSFSKAAFVHALQRLVPEIRSEDLLPGGAGVRAQAVDARGRLVDDFNIVQGEGVIHIRNVPSPAATASISIARAIADMAASSFNLRTDLTAQKKFDKVW